MTQNIKYEIMCLGLTEFFENAMNAKAFQLLKAIFTEWVQSYQFVRKSVQKNVVNMGVNYVRVI